MEAAAVEAVVVVEAVAEAAVAVVVVEAVAMLDRLSP